MDSEEEEEEEEKEEKDEEEEEEEKESDGNEKAEEETSLTRCNSRCLQEREKKKRRAYRSPVMILYSTLLLFQNFVPSLAYRVCVVGA